MQTFYINIFALIPFDSVWPSEKFIEMLCRTEVINHVHDHMPGEYRKKDSESEFWLRTASLPTSESLLHFFAIPRQSRRMDTLLPRILNYQKENEHNTLGNIMTMDEHTMLLLKSPENREYQELFWQSIKFEMKLLENLIPKQNYVVALYNNRKSDIPSIEDARTFTS